MNRELQFAEKLEEVKKKAGKQGGFISEDEVKEAFLELSLTKEQLKMVFDYLKQHKIGIGEPVNLDDYLSEDEADYLEAYLEQLQELPEASEGEKEAVTLSAMAGDADAQKRLIQIFLPYVAQVAKLYAGQGVFLEDLIGEGNIALTIGVTMLGALEHAAEAQGMLGKMMMDAMEDFIAQNTEEAKKDKRLVDKVNKVADKANELAQDLHRKVTVDELVQETGMSRQFILDAIRISGDKIEAILSTNDGGTQV